jgi:hypothetical protein
MTNIQLQIIEAATKEIKKNIDIDLKDVTILFVDKLPNNWGGSYNPTTKTIKIKETKVPYITMTMLVHELGHYIHHITFGYKKFRIPTKNKSEYAGLDFMEDFAEAFKDFICGSNRIVEERNMKIKKIFCI